MQEVYLNRIRLIYIDPPYNTGNDFLYNDDFSISSSAFFEESGQVDSDGRLLTQNTAANGRFHSDWLSMMYSRLRLARNLLSDDGAIVITIDDGEQSNLRRICDEVFGESNFIVNAIWRSKDNSNNDAKRFSLDHNHVLIYSKTDDWQPARISDPNKQKHYKNPDNDPNGPYFDGNPLNSPNHRENLIYDLESPNGQRISPPKNGWRWSKQLMKEKIKSGEIRFKEDGTGIRRRTYLKDTKGLPPSSLWTDLDKTGHNRQAKYELLKLLPEDVFETPKPVKLLKHILALSNTASEDIVLDFFAGSATTADAVIQLNSEDGGNRKFIMIQLPEPCGENSNALKSGFSTIADVGKERIRRSGVKAQEESSRSDLDIGFRVLKVDSTNLNDVYYSPDAIDQTGLFDHVENFKQDRTLEDLLFQVLLDWGVDLSLSIVRETIEEKSVFFVDETALAACFDSDISEKLVKNIARRKPLRAVFCDSGYGSDSTKINVEQIFKTISPETDVKSI